MHYALAINPLPKFALTFTGEIWFSPDEMELLRGFAVRSLRFKGTTRFFFLLSALSDIHKLVASGGTFRIDKQRALLASCKSREVHLLKSCRHCGRKEPSYCGRHMLRGR